MRRDKYKTKAQLIEELADLRARIAQLEAELAAQRERDGYGDADENGGPVDLEVPDFTGFMPLDLGRLADAVSGTIRSLIPENYEVRLSAEERIGTISAGSGAAEQIVVNLYHAHV